MLAANLAYLLSNPAERERMAVAAKQTLDEMGGALARTIEILDFVCISLDGEAQT